jgi:hypothetical protein
MAIRHCVSLLARGAQRAGLVTFSRLSTSAVALPSNLQLADVKVLEPEPVPQISKVELLFPALIAPTSIKVHRFSAPGETVPEPFRLNPIVFGVAIRF